VGTINGGGIWRSVNQWVATTSGERRSATSNDGIRQLVVFVRPTIGTWRQLVTNNEKEEEKKKERK